MTGDARLRETAIHEAGHAVMTVRCGLLLAEVSIVPEDGRLGTTTGESDYQMSATEAADAALIYLAGYAALAALGMPHAGAGCGNDFEHARLALRTWKLGTIRQWKKRAVEIMGKPQNVRAVALIADRLETNGRVAGQLVGMLVDLADGNVTSAELATLFPEAGSAAN